MHSVRYNMAQQQKGPILYNLPDHHQNNKLQFTNNLNSFKPLSSKEDNKKLEQRWKLGANNIKQKLQFTRSNNFQRWNNLKPTSSKAQQRSISRKKGGGIHNKTITSMRTEEIISNLEDVNYFSDDLIDVISNQQVYIAQFRRKLEFDKNRANTDIDLFKKQIVNMIEDYRLSVVAEMDEVFKQYMEMYSKLKHQLHDIKNTKQQIKRDLQAKECNRSFSIDSGINRSKNKSISSTKLSHQQKLKSYVQNMKGQSQLLSLPMVADNNITIIKAIEENNEDFRKYYILRYIDDMQKEKVSEIQEIANDIIVINEFDNGFYISKEMDKLLNECKNQLKAFWNGIYQGSRSHLRNISDILDKAQQQIHRIVTPDMQQFSQENLNLPKSQLQMPEYGGNPQIRRKDKNYYQEQPYQPHYQQQYQNQYQQQYQNQYQQQYPQYQSQPYSPPYHQQNNPTNRSQKVSNSKVKISPSQQVSEVYGLEIGAIKHTKCLNVSHSREISLCAIMLPTNYLAIGSRDGSIGIYNTKNDSRVQRLEGHRASVCSLAIIRSYEMAIDQGYLASGSDHDCNSVIIWNIYDWSIKHKIESHRAAVTGILDLQDGHHFLSGSYDKKINIYQMTTGRIKYNLPTNKSSVTGIIINNIGNKVITCGLDNTVNIWQVSRKSQSSFANNQYTSFKNVVQTLFLERIIENNTMICSLLGSSLRSQIIYLGTKDGKIKIIDITMGQCQKTINCSHDGVALIEMLVIERQSKPKNPLMIAFPCQQSLIRIVDTQLQSIRDFNFKSGSYLEFGCGVGPKCILFSNRKKISFGVLSHGNHKQFNIYEINV